MKNGFIITRNGIKFWYQNDKLHRIDGPAIEWSGGSKFWYQNDKLHRINGPAKEYANGSKAWYLDDIEYTEIDYYKELYRRKIISEIDCIFSITKAVF